MRKVAGKNPFCVLIYMNSSLENTDCVVRCSTSCGTIEVNPWKCSMWCSFSLPSIGFSLEAECLFFVCTWRIPSIGISTCEVSAKEEMHMRSRQRTVMRTYICGRGHEKQSPGCIKIVPYGKIEVRPRSSSDVNSNPKQTQRSNMGSIPGKTWAVYAGRKLLKAED